ncbi:unnamed protein product [Ectocarpus sp. CCAP 1310/34]|nr:unnamed protein product [Ectocarpus sp. CCAP 1310/34]
MGGKGGRGGGGPDWRCGRRTGRRAGGGDAGVNLYVIEGAVRAGALLPFPVGVTRAVGGSPREEVLLERRQRRHRMLVGDGCCGFPRAGCCISACGAAR